MLFALLMIVGITLTVPAGAAQAAPLVTMRFLMIIKPVSQVPGLTGTLNQSQIDAASNAFRTTFPRMVKDLTNDTVGIRTEVVVSSRPLTSIGHAGTMVEPRNIPEDVNQYIHDKEWDGIFVYNAFRTHGYWSSGSSGPFNTGWTSVNARDDLGYNQDATAQWVHELLHQQGEQYYFWQRNVPGAVELHSAEAHGYNVNSGGLPYWLGWYRDYLNGTIPGNLGLGPKAWNLGNRRGVSDTPAPPAATGQMIVGTGSGRCVDVSGGRNDDGAKVQLWDCHGGPEVRWSWQGAALVNAKTGKCLDVTGNGTAKGTAVQQWTCAGNGAQQWQLVNGNLRNPQSGRCLDADGWGTANETKLVIWDCGNRQSNQTWTLRS